MNPPSKIWLVIGDYTCHSFLRKMDAMEFLAASRDFGDTSLTLVAYVPEPLILRGTH